MWVLHVFESYIIFHVFIYLFLLCHHDLSAQKKIYGSGINCSALFLLKVD